MKGIVNYFTPKNETIYFNQLKTNFFIRICLIGGLLLGIYLLADVYVKSDNLMFSLWSKIVTIILIIISLFLLKKKGIVIAGNIFTTSMLVALLFFVNTFPKDVLPFYKYIQGFYSVFAYLIMGILFATKPFIIVNSILVLASTFHVYLRTINKLPHDASLYTSSFINHTFIVFVVTIIVYYGNKFIHLAIAKADKELLEKENKNQELLASEEEIRASNEELVATTDALKETNEELLLAKNKAEESDKLKTEFLNNMSHEVRTPMNGIIGFSQLLSDNEIDKSTLNNYTTIIQNSSNQLLSIIDNIIEISKLGTKQVAVFENKINLNNFLTELYTVFEIKANEKNIGFKLHKGLKDSESNILVDDLKLYSIISNLLDNAIKFTKKGSVMLSYSIFKEDDIPNLRIKVEDSGIGIETDKQSMVFEKFRQADANMSRQFGGLGLGLSIVNENIKLLKGSIKLVSEHGKGSSFIVQLPYKPI